MRFSERVSALDRESGLVLDLGLALDRVLGLALDLGWGPGWV